MPYTAPHNLLTILGTITSEGDVEQWTCGIRVAGGRPFGQPVAAAPDPDTDEGLADIQADLALWWSVISQRMPTGVAYTGFKFNAIGTDGLYLDKAQTFQRDVTPALGSGSNMLPSQTALVMTFRTAAARGLASVGRIFLPPLNATHCDAGGRVTPDALNSCANATAQLLTNLGNWPGLDGTTQSTDYGTPSIMSKVNLGATRAITGVDAGDRFDVMRSRGDKFRENRTLIYDVT